jgi:hypothetical protein
MNTSTIGRREIIVTAAGAGLSALLCRRASAQSSPDLNALAKNASPYHSKDLQQISEWLEGESITSEKGLLNLIDGLLKHGVIDAKQAEILKNLITQIFHNETVEVIEQKIREIYVSAQNSADNIVLTIAGIAQDSVAFATGLAAKVPKETVVKVLASDVSGALTGVGNRNRSKSRREFA